MKLEKVQKVEVAAVFMLFAVGFMAGVMVQEKESDNIWEKRLVANDYAHYDTKTAEFIFHEKDKL